MFLQKLPRGRPPLANMQRDEDKWRDYETVFTNSKAGMDAVDRDRVKRIVYEMSKDSPFFRQEQRKLAQTDQRIAAMRDRLARMSPAELAQHERQADARLAMLETTRDLSRTWIHCDMDAFFAAVRCFSFPCLGTGGRRSLASAGITLALSDQLTYGACHPRIDGAGGATGQSVASGPPIRCWRQEHDLDCQLRGPSVRRPIRHARLYRPKALPRAYLCPAEFCKVHGAQRAVQGRVPRVRPQHECHGSR